MSTASTCTHCGCVSEVPCWGCQADLGCLEPCPDCWETPPPLPEVTEEVPRVRHHEDGTVEPLGELDLADVPEPTAPGFADDDDFTDIPF